MEAPNCMVTPKEVLSLIINQENQQYLLTVKTEGETMIFNIVEQEKIGSLTYMKKITLEEIKKKEPKQIFSVLSSCMEFIDYLKALSDLKKIFIIKKDNKVSIKFDAEYLLKKYNVEIDLFPEKIDLESLVIDLCKEIKLINEEKRKAFEEIKTLKSELDIVKNKLKIIEEQNNKEFLKLNDEIKNLKKNNKSKDEKKIAFNSSIMNENEFQMIKSTIEHKVNKTVIGIRKLYQATIDGEESSKFHSKCDGIKNTITLIKSARNRRFGGFTSESWDTSSTYKDDNTCFLFSLDKQKIYPIKKNGKAIACYNGYGPVFGSIDCHDIQLGNTPIGKDQLYTNESHEKCNFNYFGDNNALSEDGKCSYIKAMDYEIFVILF